MEHVSQTFDKVELPAEHERNTTMTDSNIQPAKDEWERMLSGDWGERMERYGRGLADMDGRGSLS